MSAQNENSELEKAFKLNETANEYFSTQQYKKSLELYEQILPIYAQYEGKSSDDYLYSLQFVAFLKNRLADYSASRNLWQQYCEQVEKVFGPKSLRYAEVAPYLYDLYCNLGEEQKAESFLDEAEAIYVEKNQQSAPGYLNILRTKAHIYNRKSEFPSELDCYKKIESALNNLGASTGIEYGENLMNMASCYSSLGVYDEVINKGDASLRILRGQEGVAPAGLAVNLLSYSVNVRPFDMNKSIQLMEEAYFLAETQLGSSNPTYYDFLWQMANLYKDAEQYEKAIGLIDKGITLLGDKQDNHIIEVSRFYSLKSLCYFLCKRYEDALLAVNEALNTSPTNTQLLEYKSSFLYEMGKPSEALDVLLTAEKIVQESNSQSHEALHVFESLADLYSLLGNTVYTRNYQKKAMDLVSEIYGEKSIQYASKLLSYIDYDDGVQIIDQCKEALLIYKEISGVSNDNYAFALLSSAQKINIVAQRINELVKASPENKEFKEEYLTCISNSTSMIEESASIYNSLHGEDYLWSINSVEVQRQIALTANDYEKAILLAHRLESISTRLSGDISVNHADALNTLALTYYISGKNPEAFENEKKALDVYEKIYDRYHPVCVTSLSRLCTFASFKDGKEKVLLYQDLLERSKKNVTDNFLSFSSEERSLLWNQEYSNLFEISYPSFATLYNHDANPEIPGICYDALLFSKGILLNSETSIRDIILKGGDERSIQLMDELFEKRRFLEDQYKVSPTERTLDVNSLSIQINTLERELIRHSGLYKSFIERTNITWKEIKNNLSPGDVCIEFCYEPTTGKYSAYILKHDMELPVLMELFRDNQFGQISEENYYVNTDLYNLIWKPMEVYLKGASQVFFSPCGKLYSVAIESLPTGNGYMDEMPVKFQRVSSTRNLSKQIKESRVKSAVLYGGIDFNSESSGEKLIYSSNRSISPEDLDRSRFSSLPGTAQEVEEIGEMLSKSGIQVMKLKGKQATETTFKQWSGCSPELLHISTHGFYWSKSKDLARNEMESRLLQGSGYVTHESEDLLRSGLLFAGANNTLSGKHIDAKSEDGILSALEVCSLDLSNIDLLVLSACNTGLGEISSDGVFGLQRGFKKAGVNSILMSLWNVNDSVTRELVSSFYLHYLKGCGKTESLKLAKKEMREKYKDPLLWAPFILLD